MAVDASKEVRELVENATVESVLDSGFWRGLVGVLLLRLDGDWLPTRPWFAGPGDVARVGVEPLRCDRVLPLSITDVVAAKLATVRVPEIVSARRLVGEGHAKGLRVARLGGKVRFDPDGDDWWATLIRARAALGDSLLANGLKAVGNGTAYGNWIRLDQQPRSDNVPRYDLHGGERRQEVERPEEPFAWTFPPFACAVIGGGRLLMATLERLLADRDGPFVSANTDSAPLFRREAAAWLPAPVGRSGCLTARTR